MRITTLMCGLAVGLAVLFFMYTFMIEGFQGRYSSVTAYLNDPVAGSGRSATFGANSDETCKAFGDGSSGDCYKCLDPDRIFHPGTECGYWPQGKACIPRSGIYRLVPSWLTNMQNINPAYPQTFNPRDFVYNAGQCGGETCSRFTSCKTCAGSAACGWCHSTKTCMDKKIVSADWNMLGSWVSGTMTGTVKPPQMCPAPGSGTPLNSANMESDPSNASKNQLIEEVSTCPPETCEDKTNCFECTTTPGCGFCATTGKCIPVDSGGQHSAGSLGSLSGSGLCATGAIRLMPYMCPCSGIADCKTCSGQPGCGWCVAGGNCVNVDDTKGDAGVKLSDCKAGLDGVATYPGQCAPGKKLGNVRSESGKYKPGQSQLDMISENTALLDIGKGVDIAGSGVGVIGSKPVTAPKTTQVSGNSVVPGAAGGRAGGPYTITNQPNLFTSPFEEYVKVLIKSELAESGIPTNEPFQNPGMVRNIMKDVNKVVKMNF